MSAGTDWNDEEQVRRRMEERARRLALPPPAEEHAAGLSFVTFRTGAERYALASQFVRAIVRTVHVTAVPGTPVHIAGLTNFRGEMLAVIELAQFFGLPPRTAAEHARMIVCGERVPEIGILADEADETCILDPRSLHPRAAASVDGAAVLGLTEDAVIVLDAPALLSHRGLIVEHETNHRRSSHG